MKLPLPGPGTSLNSGVTITLDDNTIIRSDSWDVDNLVGSILTYENGEPLKSGRYITATRLLLIVGPKGVCKSQEYDAAASLLI